MLISLTLTIIYTYQVQSLVQSSKIKISILSDLKTNEMCPNL